MNVEHQVIYRCIHAACARPLPRRVNFCPYCGTGQHDGVVKPSHAAPLAAPSLAPALAPPLAPPPAPAVTAAPQSPVSDAAQPPAAVPSAAGPAAPPAKGPVKPGGVTQPPRREPVRLRWWLVTLAALWAIWLYARPSASKIDTHIARATLASAECRLNDAQSELIALRMTRATPQQLASLQATINAASTGCARKKARVKAWEETTVAIDNALASNDFARALTRLAQFTRRWNSDADSDRLRDKIREKAAEPSAAAAPAPLAPLGPPPAPVVTPLPAPSSAQAQSVRNLIDEAERALAAGNYRAAADKLEVCTTMVDPGNRECAAFKVHADRLQRDQRRCLLEGRQWADDRCV